MHKTNIAIYKGMITLGNTIYAYCNACETYTDFCFDGEDWECQSCNSYNTQSDHNDSENPYNLDWNPYSSNKVKAYHFKLFSIVLDKLHL